MHLTMRIALKNNQVTLLNRKLWKSRLLHSGRCKLQTSKSKHQNRGIRTPMGPTRKAKIEKQCTGKKQVKQSNRNPLGWASTTNLMMLVYKGDSTPGYNKANRTVHILNSLQPNPTVTADYQDSTPNSTAHHDPQREYE